MRRFAPLLCTPALLALSACGDGKNAEAPPPNEATAFSWVALSAVP